MECLFHRWVTLLLVVIHMLMPWLVAEHIPVVAEHIATEHVVAEHTVAEHI